MEKYLVTGASGYIASWIVKYLLEQGEMVNATVRKISDTRKTEHLIDLQKQFPGRLNLFEADLLNRESFRKPMEGCTYVLHTASPFFIAKIRDAQKELINPALEGTRNVLTMANETATVKRVVVTSSVAAIYSDAVEIYKVPGQRFDETMWNTTSNLKHNPYNYSKTVAEREAWDIAESQSRWSMVTINPGFVLGPSLTKRVDSTSIDTLRSILNGKFRTGVPDLYFGIVDVRDVAKAHILAAMREDASGRYICVGSGASVLEMAGILRDVYPKRPIPTSLLPKFLLYLVGPLMGFSWKFLRGNYGIPYRFDNTRSIWLGVKYTSLKNTLTDHAEQLIQDGLV